MTKKTGNFSIPCWSPGDDFFTMFNDKTGEARTPEQTGQMVKELREVANKYNFDLSSWGTKKKNGQGIKH